MGDVPMRKSFQLEVWSLKLRVSSSSARFSNDENHFAFASMPKVLYDFKETFSCMFIVTFQIVELSNLNSIHIRNNDHFFKTLNIVKFGCLFQNIFFTILNQLAVSR